MIGPACTNCDSPKCFINNFTKKEWKSKINKERTTLKISKSLTIFNEGDPVQGIYFIYKGKVKVYNNGVKNRTQIVRLANAGQILGHRGLGVSHKYPIGASTLENSTLCFIPMHMFEQALKHNPELVIELMTFFAEELRRAENKLRSLSQMTVRQKMAEAFITLHEIYGSSKIENVSFLNVELSRQDYADIIGASLEEVIRTISIMTKSKLIHIKGKRIGITDPQKLADMLVDFGSLRLP